MSQSSGLVGKRVSKVPHTNHVLLAVWRSHGGCLRLHNRASSIGSYATNYTLILRFLARFCDEVTSSEGDKVSFTV